MVSDVTIASALNDQQRTQAASDGLAEDFSEFLTLLTVQLQNQDPLSPMDTTEFTNQLVAFTGVEQQINTNQKLDNLVSLELSNTMASALNYVGLNASYVSSEFYQEPGQTSSIEYAYQGEPFEAVIRIIDSSGDIVYEEDASTNAAGSNTFTWDGTTSLGQPVAEGTYEIRIDALDFEGNAVPTTAVVNGDIRGIETQNGSIFALIGDRAVSIGNILNVSQPEQAETQDAPAADDSGSADDNSDGTDNANDNNNGGTNA